MKKVTRRTAFVTVFIRLGVIYHSPLQVTAEQKAKQRTGSPKRAGQSLDKGKPPLINIFSLLPESWSSWFDNHFFSRVH